MINNINGLLSIRKLIIFLCQNLKHRKILNISIMNELTLIHKINNILIYEQLNVHATKLKQAKLRDLS